MKRIAAIVFFLTLILTLPAFAGTTGVLEGRIIERNSGRPIAGATVVATSPSQEARAISDAAGNYVFINLAPGTYTVTVEARGYTPISMAGVPVQADQVQSVCLTTYRRLVTRTDQGLRLYSRTSLVRSGIVSDVYVIYFGTYNDPSVPSRTTSDALQFVPGVQAVPGQPVQHR